MVHHNNCTYCIYRLCLPAGTKTKKREIERCAVTGKDCSPPMSNDRYCEGYVQRNCTCERCAPILDKL